MKILSFFFSAMFMIILLAGCAPKERVLDIDEYDVYQDGECVWAFGEFREEFAFTDADSHSLDPADIETRQGLQLGDSLEKFELLYEGCYILVTHNEDETWRYDDGFDKTSLPKVYELQIQTYLVHGKKRTFEQTGVKELFDDSFEKYELIVTFSDSVITEIVVRHWYAYQY